jgi:hypothetical protein
MKLDSSCEDYGLLGCDALPLAAYLLLDSCLSYSLALKMEVIRSSETSVDFYQNAQRRTPKDHIHHILRIFENKSIRIFGPEREEITGGWRKLRSEELYNLHSSPNISRVM